MKINIFTYNYNNNFYINNSFFIPINNINNTLNLLNKMSKYFEINLITSKDNIDNLKKIINNKNINILNDEDVKKNNYQVLKKKYSNIIFTEIFLNIIICFISIILSIFLWENNLNLNYFVFLLIVFTIINIIFIITVKEKFRNNLNCIIIKYLN